MVPPQVVPEEVEFTAMRASGPGGQNVNKVSSAVQLRYDIRASSLPSAVKARLLATRDQRVTKDGEIVIKAQTARTQDRNKAEALQRLQEMVDAAAHVPTPRKPTKPTYSSTLKRLEGKSQRAQVKAGRGKVDDT